MKLNRRICKRKKKQVYFDGWIRLHVTGVTHTSMSRLWCSFIVAHLQVQMTLIRTQLFIGELTFILVSHLWSKWWSIVLWVLLSLFDILGRNHLEHVKSVRIENQIAINSNGAYKTGQWIQAQCNLWDVTFLEQISCLEDFFFW